MTLFLLTQHFPNNIQYFVTSGNNPIQKPLTREIPMNVLTKENFFQVEQISVGKSFVLDVKNVRVALTISMLIKPDLLWAKLYFESL